MDKIVADYDVIHGFGASCAQAANDVVAVAATDQAAVMAATIPVFGLIGQDFLMALAYTQANNLLSVAELAHVYGTMGMAAEDATAAHVLNEEIGVRAFASVDR
ncbi:hypothetical protein [Nocardia sp. NPDC003963]